MDQRYQLENGEFVESDGLITDKEIVSNDIRAMFATMNDYNESNRRLSVERNKDTSMMEYQFLYSYGKEFDGINWGERASANRSYVEFRGGGDNIDVTRRKNSFYFYFGLNEGKTAIEKFNSQFYAECGPSVVSQDCVVSTEVSDWCDADKTGNKIILRLSKNIYYPISVTVTNIETGEVVYDTVANEKNIAGNDGKAFYTMTVANGVDGVDLKYGEYAVNVADAENYSIFDKAVSLYPQFVEVEYGVMSFNVESSKLAAIINDSINDPTRINYANGNVVYGNSVNLTVYQQGDRFEGKVDRKVNANGRMVELGGTIALRMAEGTAKNAIVNIEGDILINGSVRHYSKSYSGNAILGITNEYKVMFNDTETVYDVVCLCVPYFGTYKVSVEHLCGNGVDNGDSHNIWQSDIKVGEYIEPVITFADVMGNSMSYNDVKSFIDLVGGANAAWNSIIDKGGVLDIMVNDSNVYYQRLLSVYEQGGGLSYDKLNAVVGGFEELLPIGENLEEAEKREIEISNAAAEEHNKEMIKEALIRFYQIFTRSQDQDGLTITSNNDVTLVDVENVSYRVIRYNDGYIENDEYKGKVLTNSEFNLKYGDFSTNEAVLLDNKFEGVIITYDNNAPQYKYTCKIDNPLGGGVSILDFYLFDKRMEIEVMSVGNFYKYKEDDEYNIEKVFAGNLALKVRNGFQGYTVTNLYENWAYDGADGSLYPVDENGNAIQNSLFVEYSPYSNDSRMFGSRHPFSINNGEGVSRVIVQDGIGNIVQADGISMDGECTLGLGGMLLVGNEFNGKGNMKEDYGSYVPDRDFYMWTDATINVSADGNKCNIIGMLGGDRDTTTNSIGWRAKTSVATDSISVSGYFRNWSEEPIVGKGMAVEYLRDNADRITDRATAKVLNVCFCDTYSFECTNTTHRVYLYSNSGGKDADLRRDADNLPYLYRTVSGNVQPLNANFGMYFTWVVRWPTDSEGKMADFFDVTGETAGFYLKEKSGNPIYMYLDKYDEDQEMDTENNGNEGTMYWVNYENPVKRRLHWLQNLFVIGNEYQRGFNLLGSGLDMGHSKDNVTKEYGGHGVSDNGCIYTEPGTQMNSGAFLWVGRGSGSEAYGYPRTYCYNSWAHFDFGNEGKNWAGPKEITGVLLTSGPIVSRHVVGGSEGVTNHSYKVVGVGNTY